MNIEIPETFTLPDRYIYPPHNNECFEDYFIRKSKGIISDRVYLPIAWSSYLRRANYGKNMGMMSDLQKWFNKLPRDKKYFTVVTWDDGIKVHTGDIDIKIFAASGPRIDYPIPLLCKPHPFNFPRAKKDIQFSFIGGLTHKIRFDLVNAMQNVDGFYVSSHPHHTHKYCEILARSKYVLCPRGYGQTSFRICEAIQYGAIPIYISDEYIIPYNYERDWQAIKIGSFMARQFVSTTAKEQFTYEYCRNKILENA